MQGNFRDVEQGSNIVSKSVIVGWWMKNVGSKFVCF